MQLSIIGKEQNFSRKAWRCSVDATTVSVDKLEAVITAPKQLVVGVHATLKSQVNELWGTGVRHFIVDFTFTEVIDSSGLGALVSLHNDLKQKSARMVLRNLHGRPMDVIKGTQIDRLLDIEE